MDIFGIGSAELLLLAFFALAILGPRRLTQLARQGGKLMAQVRALTGDLTKQLNREIDLLEIAEGTSTQSGNSEEQRPEETGSSVDKLPEAYRRFREDFPNEGKLDNQPKEAGPRKGQAGLPRQPVETQSAAQPGDAGAAVAPASLSPGKD